jgi:hypothetical protein
MRSAIYLVSLVSLLLIGVPSVGAQGATQSADPASEATNCIDPLFLSTALIDCGTDLLSQLDTTAELDASSDVASEIEALDAPASALETSEAFVIPSYCRLKVDAVFWGGRQPVELAQAIADDYSHCAEYHITVPPRNNNNRTRPPDCELVDDIRDLNPRIHPLAEIRWTSPGGWRRWVVGPTHPDGWRSGRTFYGAGVTARQRMAACGLDVTAGETWAFNELDEEVLENTLVVDGPHAGKSARVEVLEFMRGLYDGLPGMPKARGIVFNLTTRSDLTELTEYKELLQSWLEDEPFWTELDTYANFFAHEVYASSRSWGVVDAPLARRARSLNDYFHHPMILAENGPPAAEAARNFFRRTYVPLANAAWPHPSIGETHVLSAKAMSEFISTQVYAMRHYSNSHPQTGPQGRIGFGWAPIEEFDEHGYTDEGRDMIRERLASAIHEASEEGTNSQMGACGPPGAHVWCGVVDVEGAFLNDAWNMFASWD